MVKSFELLRIVPAIVHKHGSIGDSRVTLAENESVPVLPVGILNIEVKILVIKNGQHIHNTHTAADMTAACPICSIEAESAQLVSLLLESQPFLLC